jgi:hypothetical protein
MSFADRPVELSEVVGDTDAVVTAFRAWRIGTDPVAVTPRVFSLINSDLQTGDLFEWSGKLLRAECVVAAQWLLKPHLAPSAHCECGGYAYHTPKVLLDVVEQAGRPWIPRQFPDLTVPVAGVCRLAVPHSLVHHDGVRASEIEAVALVRPRLDNHQRLVGRAAAAWGVPVIEPSEMGAFARSKGILIADLMGQSV